MYNLIKNVKVKKEIYQRLGKDVKVLLWFLW